VDPVVAEKARLVASRFARATDASFLHERAPCVSIEPSTPLRRRLLTSPSSDGLRMR
jgi:hypothetical protein